MSGSDFLAAAADARRAELLSNADDQRNLRAAKRRARRLGRDRDDRVISLDDHAVTVRGGGEPAAQELTAICP